MNIVLFLEALCNLQVEQKTIRGAGSQTLNDSGHGRAYAEYDGTMSRFLNGEVEERH